MKEANSSSRKDQIPIEIRDIEGKIDSLREKIGQEKANIDKLRDTVELQNAISMLQEDIDKELDSLISAVSDESSRLQEVGLPKVNVPSDDDDDGTKVIREFESLGKSSEQVTTAVLRSSHVLLCCGRERS